MKISIIGQSMTQFGELWERSFMSLVEEAVETALQSAKIDSADIDAVFLSTMLIQQLENQSHLNPLVSELFSHFPPVYRLEAACASGSIAMLHAVDSLRSGRYETVLVLGAEKMTDVSTEQITQYLSGAADQTRQFGSTFPGLYALVAQKYLHKHGLHREILSQVSVQNHEHALSNEKAHFQKKISIEQVEASAPLASPLKLLDASPISDGAAAVVLTSRSVANVPKIIGSAMNHDYMTLAERDDASQFLATQRAMKSLLLSTGMSQDEIDTVELHDCFSIAQLVALEDMGFYEPGCAQDSLRDRKRAINKSGGLKACGHPIGATGVKQVAQVAEYVRTGESRRALTHNVGGVGGTAILHVISA